MIFIYDQSCSFYKSQGILRHQAGKIVAATIEERQQNFGAHLTDLDPFFFLFMARFTEIWQGTAFLSGR